MGHQEKRRGVRIVAALAATAMVASIAAVAQQADLDKLLKTGKPAQLYAAALDYEIKGDKDQAGSLYRALIAKYPDSPYAEKVIAKLEAGLKAAEDRKMADEQAKLMLEQKARNHDICVNRCAQQQTQCLAAAENAGDEAVLGGLLGILSGDDGSDAIAGMTTSAINADNQSSSCTSNHDTCVAACL